MPDFFIPGGLFITMSNRNSTTPLAEQLRPRSIDEFVGQRHILGEGGLIRVIIEKKRAFSMILWGDPGTGKTSLARIIAGQCSSEAHFLSAVSSGVKDVRQVIDRGKHTILENPPLLFLDEIHRFNKAQQDAVLGAVESGEIVLIGATTENPSFQVIAPLLSRTRVVRLYPLDEEDLLVILERALGGDQLKGQYILEDEVKAKLARLSIGDARRMLNVLETACQLAGTGTIGEETILTAFSNSTAYYDRAGDRHYDTISAFIKSLRGSDPNAAVYYLARMIHAGEDPEFIARRMVIFASEDVGNASPNAISIAVSVFLAVKNIGLPEAEIILSQCATFLASSPKSNASYVAIREAKDAAEDFSIQIPLHIRNAPTGLMKKMGYGRDYRYPHDFEGHFVKEQYLPDVLKDRVFYRPGLEGSERAIRERLIRLWPEKYKSGEKNNE